MRLRPWDNVGLKLFALVMALLLWVLVKGGEEGAERVVSARLEFQEVPLGVALVSPLEPTILLRLRGPKRKLESLDLDEVAFSLASREVREGSHVVSLAPGEVRGIPRGLELLEVSPRTLRIQAEAIVQNDVEVHPRVEGDPRLGFEVRGVWSEPRTVKIAGPRSLVRGIVQAYTLPVSVEGRSEDFSTETSLEPVGPQVRFLHQAPVRVSIEIAPHRSDSGRGVTSPPVADRPPGPASAVRRGGAG